MRTRGGRCAIGGLCGAVVVALSTTAAAANVTLFVSGTGTYRTVVIEGPIERGDYEKVIGLVKEGQGRVGSVTLFSPGGDFEEAIKIGDALRALELGSTVPSVTDAGGALCGFSSAFPAPKDPSNCTAASAAFFIHVGAVQRSGLYLVVHRPYFGSKAFGQLSERDAEKAFDGLQRLGKTYMEKMGVPEHVQEDVLGTASDQGLILDQKTVRTYFLGDLPFYHEWIRSKCNNFTDDEAARLDGYGQRILANHDPRQPALSRQEYADLGVLQQKQKVEMDCEIAAAKDRRIAAYTKFFGAKPDDAASQNFAEWASAVTYLGRPFDELLATKHATEERFAGMSTLKLPATGTTPMIQLYDSRSSPRTVQALSVLSAPNPSTAFTNHLVLTLDAAFGAPASSSPQKREWVKDRYTATLNLDSRGVEGVTNVLQIEIR